MTTSSDHSTDGLDFDSWLGRIPDHVDELRERLSEQAREAARLASIERRRPLLVDPSTGHTPSTQLCWVCGAMPVHSGPRVPTFRACRFCVAYDRQRASRLGLLMLLPLMDWPSQPVLPGREFPSDPAVREALADVWSGVSTLDGWRVSLAQFVFSMLTPSEVAVGVDLFDWQQRVTVGPWKAQASWRAYVDGYFPALSVALATSPVPEHGIVR